VGPNCIVCRNGFFTDADKVPCAGGGACWELSFRDFGSPGSLDH
jgi:hypothetical protein